MLTKEEREKIAERCKNYGENNHSVLKNTYECLLGRLLPGINETTAREDCREIAARLLDLCDTSNMIELPLDKNGEIIRPGDVVYGEDNLRHEVYQIVFDGDSKWLVLIRDGRMCAGTYYSPISFSHKQPITINSVANRIKNILVDDFTRVELDEVLECVRTELVDITEDLASLGDSDD